MKKIIIIFLLSINLCFAAAFNKQTLDMGDTKLNYYKVGHGSPVVLIMGYGLTNNFWPKSFINCLSHNHTLYILDYINVAKPDMNLIVEEVNKFIKLANLDHPEVIGWSMGGGIALSLADKYPYSISKIGLISSIVAEPSISQMVPPYQAKNNSTNEKLDYVFGNNIHGYKTKDLTKYKKEMLSGDVFVNSNTLNLQKGVLANWMANPDNSAMVAHLRIPANVIIARYDAILNPQMELQSFRKYSKAKITILDSGHASFYQFPDQVCKAVLD